MQPRSRYAASVVQGAIQIPFYLSSFESFIRSIGKNKFVKATAYVYLQKSKSDGVDAALLEICFVAMPITGDLLCELQDFAGAVGLA
ncbi:hypothetical protein EN873_17595 [bacterium M00.F.Ca.ET.230.01.1.1]|nr:hypothetical protein EN873_17595 [bacterium M00.F.Ca.ET.230.01.1.1]